MRPYNSKEWQQFRSAVIELDGNHCVECGRGAGDGVTLHVHHKEYLFGRLPWEYSYDQCETLCAGCHAAHHGKIPPKVGWTVIGYDDLGDLSGSCELCGTDIRHTFLVHHPNWPSMEIGEICCNHLTCSDLASNHMESVRRYNDRKKRFVSSTRWKKFQSRHEYIKQGRIVIELRKLSGGLQLRMNGLKGKIVYPDAVVAKARAFDVLESRDFIPFVSKLGTRPRPLGILLSMP